MRRFATGVTIVTTLLDDRRHGFTANAFASVSADPPMVLICVNRGAASHEMISRSRIFCVNVLSLEGQPIAERFSSSRISDKFEGMPARTARTGAPVLPDAFAYFDCTLAEEHRAGTHTIFLGNVVGLGASTGSPLGYFDGRYADFHLSIDPS